MINETECIRFLAATPDYQGMKVLGESTISGFRVEDYYNIGKFNNVLIFFGQIVNYVEKYSVAVHLSMREKNEAFYCMLADLISFEIEASLVFTVGINSIINTIVYYKNLANGHDWFK